MILTVTNNGEFKSIVTLFQVFTNTKQNKGDKIDETIYIVDIKLTRLLLHLFILFALRSVNSTR